MKDKLHQYNVVGSSGIHKVTEYDDHSWACSCPAWIYHRGSRIDCKHIKEIKSQIPETTLNITGINNSITDIQHGKVEETLKDIQTSIGNTTFKKEVKEVTNGSQ